MAPAVQGDQLAGCSVTVARAAVRELVKLHAPTWQDASLRGIDWISERTPREGRDQWRELYRASLPPFLDRFAPVLADDEREIIERVAESKGPPFTYPPEPWALVHIDYRLDNLLIDERVTPPRVAVVDWQSCAGPPLSDLAYFLGAWLLPEVRRPVERELVREYHEGLVAAGVRGYLRSDCWADYRRGAFAGLRGDGDRVDDRAGDRARQRDVHRDGAPARAPRARPRLRRVPLSEATAMAQAMNELGFYTLAGQPQSPRELIDEVREAEALGSARASSPSASTSRRRRRSRARSARCRTTIGIATAATNHNTRHPMVTAAYAMTMHRLTGGRFSLGLGRGIAPHVRDVRPPADHDRADRGLRRADAAALARRDGARPRRPAGKFGLLIARPRLRRRDPDDLHRVRAELARARRAGVRRGRAAHVLHRRDDRALRARREAGAPSRRAAIRRAVRVWSCFATIGDHLPEPLRLKKTVGRMATYLQALRRLHGQDQPLGPGVLARFRADPVVAKFPGAIDASATTEQLEHIAKLIPAEWLAPAATGSPAQCVAKVRAQLDLGCDGVILHGASPARARADRARVPPHPPAGPLRSPGREPGGLLRRTTYFFMS